MDEEKEFDEVNREEESKDGYMPFRGMVHEKQKHKAIYFTLLGLALIILVMGYFLLTGKRGSKSPKIRQMEELVTEISGLESDIQEKQNEIFGLLSDYKKRTGKDLPSVNLLNLTDREKRLLEKKISEEKDVSIKSLLNDILEKNSDIRDLMGKLKEVEALLPKPHIVVRGQNHYKIAMNFLVKEKGLDREKSMKLVERAALFEYLMPGFKVWNFYSADEFGTFVTQGTAPISPNTVRRKAKKKITDARDKAISERDNLAEEIKLLMLKREELISQLDLLNQEKTQLISRMGELNEQNLEMQQSLNSLFFCLDLKRNLKKRGVIKAGFLSSPKLRKFSPELFNMSVDLRDKSEITVSAAGFNIKKIKNLVLYPRFYRKGIDYSVQIENGSQNATLKILDTMKLKNERVVISVE